MSREPTRLRRSDRVYGPAEDSFLLEKYVQLLVIGEVLDVGTGSGIQAVSAAHKPDVSRVVAIDIELEVLEIARWSAKLEKVEGKITFIQSDLFENVTGVYDWLVFNPPYLPSESGLTDPTWDGGPKGGDMIKCFLRSSRKYMKKNGSILMVYSSETQINFKEYGFSCVLLEEISLFFETIYCVRLSPS
jgi:release factor glutamine methyltransferase